MHEDRVLSCCSEFKLEAAMALCGIYLNVGKATEAFNTVYFRLVNNLLRPRCRLKWRVGLRIASVRIYVPWLMQFNITCTGSDPNKHALLDTVAFLVIGLLQWQGDSVIGVAVVTKIIRRGKFEEPANVFISTDEHMF